MALYVLDATAVIALGSVCDVSPHDPADVGDAMTSLAMVGDLLCPATVLPRCQAVGAGEFGTRWLRSNSGHFSGVEEPWEYVETVLSSCEEMIDIDDTNENVQVSVLAVGLRLSESRDDVVIVTDQWADTPWLMSQATAARRLALSVIPVDQFVNEVMAA